MDLEKIIRNYLADVIHMSLGTASHNKPWVCEVHFAYDDNLNLYFASLPARRHSQEIAANPFVAGTIHKQHRPEDSPMGIYYEGIANKLVSEEEQKIAIELLKKRIFNADHIIAGSTKPDGPKFYKIAVDKFYIFGNLDNTAPKKHELLWHK